MTRKPVTSSSIASFGYDEKAHALEVEFKDGSVYQYAKVSPTVYRDLLEAPSPGGYFHKNIRGQYATQKV